MSSKDRRDRECEARERLLWSIGAAMRNGKFESKEELQAYVNALVGQLFPDDALSTKENAWELAYQAMEEFPSKRAIALARKAIVLDPSCTDAEVILANLTSNSQEERVEVLEKAVQRARSKLGEDTFQEDSYGHLPSGSVVAEGATQFQDGKQLLAW